METIARLGLCLHLVLRLAGQVKALNNRDKEQPQQDSGDGDHHQKLGHGKAALNPDKFC